MPLPARRDDNRSQRRKPTPHWRTWQTLDDIGWVSLGRYYDDLQEPPINPPQQRGVNKYPCVIAYTRPKGIPAQYMIGMLFEARHMGFFVRVHRLSKPHDHVSVPEQRRLYRGIPKDGAPPDSWKDTRDVQLFGLYGVTPGFVLTVEITEYTVAYEQTNVYVATRTGIVGGLAEECPELAHIVLLDFDNLKASLQVAQGEQQQLRQAITDIQQMFTQGLPYDLNMQQVFARYTDPFHIMGPRNDAIREEEERIAQIEAEENEVIAYEVAGEVVELTKRTAAIVVYFDGTTYGNPPVSWRGCTVYLQKGNDRYFSQAVIEERVVDGNPMCVAIFLKIFLPVDERSHRATGLSCTLIVTPLNYPHGQVNSVVYVAATEKPISLNPGEVKEVDWRNLPYSVDWRKGK